MFKLSYIMLVSLCLLQNVLFGANFELSISQENNQTEHQWWPAECAQVPIVSCRRSDSTILPITIPLTAAIPKYFNARAYERSDVEGEKVAQLIQSFRSFYCCNTNDLESSRLHGILCAFSYVLAIIRHDDAGAHRHLLAINKHPLREGLIQLVVPNVIKKINLHSEYNVLIPLYILYNCDIEFTPPLFKQLRDGLRSNQWEDIAHITFARFNSKHRSNGINSQKN